MFIVELENPQFGLANRKASHIVKNKLRSGSSEENKHRVKKVSKGGY